MERRPGPPPASCRHPLPASLFLLAAGDEPAGFRPGMRRGRAQARMRSRPLSRAPAATRPPERPDGAPGRHRRPRTSGRFARACGRPARRGLHLYRRQARPGVRAGAMAAAREPRHLGAGRPNRRLGAGQRRHRQVLGLRAAPRVLHRGLAADLPPAGGRLYDDRLELFLSGTHVLTLPRGRAGASGPNVHVVNYRHVIHSLKKKPMALKNLVYRDELFPREPYRRCFEKALERVGERQACRLAVGLLALAHARQARPSGKTPRAEPLRRRHARPVGIAPAGRCVSARRDLQVEHRAPRRSGRSAKPGSHPDRCATGRSLARHGTYERKEPAGRRVFRWYCPGEPHDLAAFCRIAWRRGCRGRWRIWKRLSSRPSVGDHRKARIFAHFRERAGHAGTA